MTDEPMITLTQADREAWEKYGPMIFHCEITGPEVLARHAAQAREQAEKEHETFCKSWGMQKRMGVLEKELVRAEAHRNSLMDKIQSQLTEIGALKAQISQARVEAGELLSDPAIEAACKAHCDYFGGAGWWDAGLIADTKPKAYEAMRLSMNAALSTILRAKEAGQ